MLHGGLDCVVRKCFVGVKVKSCNRLYPTNPQSVPNEEVEEKVDKCVEVNLAFYPPLNLISSTLYEL